MSRLNNNCESCVGARGQCEDSYPSFNNAQGQINVCPSSANWNYAQSGLFQLRNIPAPAYSFLATTDPMSFDLANPERYRPLTRIAAAPQKLANGSFTLNSDSLHTFNRSYIPTLTPVNKANFSMYAELPSGHFNSSYCGPEFHNCFYKQGMAHAGPARDGCVSVGTPCGQALSGI